MITIIIVLRRKIALVSGGCEGWRSFLTKNLDTETVAEEQDITSRAHSTAIMKQAVRKCVRLAFSPLFLKEHIN